MEETVEERPRRMRLAWLVLPFVLFAVAAALVRPVLERAYLLEASDAAEATLRLTTEGLNGAVKRFEPLPGLISDRPVLHELLRDPANEGLLPYVNEQLRQTAHRLDASDIYVMDPTGLTIAASNYRKDASFVGKSFTYRPYFTEALSGGTGRFHALGTTSGERGIFFAAPVLDGVHVLGVVAVKFTVETFEDAWHSSGQDVLVSDRNGVVFMASREDWLFRTLAPLSDTAQSFISLTRQYPENRMRALEQEAAPFEDRVEHWTIAGESFAVRSAALPGHDFTIHVLTAAAPAVRQAWAALGVAALGFAILALVATVFLMRRARILERMEHQRLRETVLEARVAERTKDLRREVEERTAAETRLRTTQKQLVQAGKLAALGQMSAALSHEINQPLAAVKSYAENAATFLDRDRTGEARENVARISQMADRMAAISGHLRNFARRPQEDLGAIPADAVIDDALGLMDAQIRKAGAEVSVARPEGPVWVIGGRLRLQQVVVNLISNALDAMDESPDPRIEIRLSEKGGTVRLAVRDHGPGLPEEVREQVFDPFFTTKRPGKGLGLGLSISFNIIADFGGRLSARTHEDGGAEFTVDLKATPATGESEMAAE